MTGKTGTTNEASRLLWVAEALARLAPGKRILDAGAGEQQYRRYCDHLKYVSQDFALYDGIGDGAGLRPGKWAQGNLDIVGDVCSIPEPDSSFDAILCTEVLEHLPRPLDALREFARLLKNGGELILTAPFCSLTHFAPFHFHAGFNRYFYETHLPSLGFVIEELEANGNFFEYLAQELRRMPEVAQRYCGSSPRRWEWWAMRVVLAALTRFSASDGGSKELVHYGFHVRARRQS